MLQQSHLHRNKPQSQKQRIFRLFHSLLKHYSIHPNFYYFLLIFQILQLVNYSLHKSLGTIWGGQTLNYFQIFLSYTDLSYFWKNTGSSSLTSFVIISFIFNAIVLAIIIYQIKKNPTDLQNPNTFGFKFLNYYGVLIKTILFLPLGLAYSCFASASLYNLSSSSQIVLAIFSGLGMALLFINISLFVLFFRESSPFSKLPFASPVNSVEQTKFVFKLCLGIYGSFADSNLFLSKLFAISFILFCLWLSYISLKRPSLINYPYNRINELGPIICVWIMASVLAQLIIQSQSSLGFWLCFLGIIWIPFGWSHMKSANIMDLLTASYKSLSNVNDCLSYNFQCIRLANNRDDTNIQILEGILNFHLLSCKKTPELCVCTAIRNNLLTKKLDQDRREAQQQRQKWFQFIRGNLRDVRQKYDNTTQIKFLLSYIENDVLSNKFRSLHSLQEARHDNKSLKFQFLDYHYLREIQKKMQSEDRINNQKQPVDINRYYNFEIGFGKLQDLMEQSAYQHIKFWQGLKSQKASKVRLYDQGQAIQQKLQEIQKSYQKLTHINPNNIHCMILFANFMKVIVNSNEIYDRNQEAIMTAKKTFIQSMKMQGDIQKQKYGDNSISGIVIISGQRSNIGIIKHCNWKVNQILGYAPHQLLGQNINIIMPKFIGNMHDDVLRNYLQLSQSSKDYKERLVPMIDSRNFMILGRALTKPLPSLLNGLELVGIFNSVIESNSHHPGQVPKYVLFRSDTGQVQALSQSCYNQFQYKINKIDQNNETSSQLSFNTLFLNVKEQEINQKIGIKCKVIGANMSEDQDQIPVQVFQRLQIYYYSVKLKLLYFYTLKTYKNVEESLVSGGQTAQKVGNVLTSQNDWDKGNKSQRTNNQDKAIKQKYLHEMSKKNTLVGNQPIAMKILRIWGYGYLLVFLGLAIFLVVFHTRSALLNDYLSMSKLSGESLGNLCQISFNTRLMHLSNSYSANLSPFNSYQINITRSITSLQQCQFSLQSINLNYGIPQIDTKQWTITSNGTIISGSGAYSLSNSVFDLITAASSYNQKPVSSLNYPFNLSQITNYTEAVFNQFFIIYNSIFQTIPQKSIYQQQANKVFQNLLSSQASNNKIALIVIVLVIFVVFATATPLSLVILRAIDDTILLFGHLTPGQVQRQIQNCNHFLQIFYHDSYLIKLKNKQKVKNQFNTIFKNQQTTQHNNVNQNSTSNIKSFVLSQPEGKQQQSKNQYQKNVVKASLRKIQFLQKQLHLRTQAQIMISQVQAQGQTQLLRNQGEPSQEQGSIYDKLSQDGDHSRSKVIILYILLILLHSTYFIVQYFISLSAQTTIQNYIRQIQQTYLNINSLNLMKVYTLQKVVVNNAQFMSYPKLNDSLTTIYNQLYQNQRNFDNLVRPYNASIYPYYYADICETSVLSQMNKVTGSIVVDPLSLTNAECKILLDGFLQEGIRLGIIAYTQTLLKISKKLIGQAMTSQQFKQVRRIFKFLQIPLRYFLNVRDASISQNINKKSLILISFLIGFIFATIVLFICIWRKNVHHLYKKLTMTRTILGFIPVRVFVRNTKLTKQYQKYIGDLMQ